VGQSEQALTSATALLRSKHLTLSQRSECETVVGKILFDEGDAENGLDHLQRAAFSAHQGCDFHGLFAAKLFTLIMLSDRFGPAAASSVLADLRQLATKLGDAEVTARLHLFVAQAEAKRGLLDNAKRHTSIARRLLKTSSNVYLAAFIANQDLAFAVLRSEFDVAKECGQRAIKLADQSGVGKLRKAVFGNMGNLYSELGEFDRATQYFESALSIPPANGANTTAVLESLARVHLLQDRVDSCLAVLDRIESSIHVEQDRLSYEQRYSALTRIHLLARQGHTRQALEGTHAVLELAQRASDSLLQRQGLLTQADLLQKTGEVQASMALISEIVPGLMGLSPELHARSEQVLACALARCGDEDAEMHRDRAHRIYRSIGSIPRLQELELSWNQAHAASRHGLSFETRGTEGAESQESRGVRLALDGIATAFAHASRPDLVARELLQILGASDSAHNARATLTDAKGVEEDIGKSDSNSCRVAGERQFSVGFKDEREVHLHICPKSSLASVSAINAVTLLLASLHEVQRARADREAKATLWPIEELPNQERSVISGQMLDLMNYARRIARTKVNVLITGESGTGKEILARAIHDFSDRAGKAFVPFNCTAIPRDLLESQLFGHRRGAFTGADRDQLGLIRSAREGTLFLDEVGELGLDLQPKLLRFLESGEISPLGEPGSMTIDVRIVAATNSNLEDAVRAGRFREDLFYRLNVVRLSIPPLRERRDEIPGFVNHFITRAADEFKKGQLRVAEETMERLLLYRWPGNVRQLQNEMRRMVALAEPDATLLPHDISEDILGALPNFHRPSTSDSEITVDLNDKLMPAIARLESEMIKSALKRHGGKVDGAAMALGISRKGLYLKRQRLGL